jgi:hypothetical protein
MLKKAAWAFVVSLTFTALCVFAVLWSPIALCAWVYEKCHGRPQANSLRNGRFPTCAT